MTGTAGGGGGGGDPYAGWTWDQFQQASIAEIAAGRLPLEAQRRLALARGDDTFTSTLSVDEHHALRSAGFTPVGQVLGSCVYQIGYTGTWNCGYFGFSGAFGGRRAGWSPGMGTGVSSPGWQPRTWQPGFNRGGIGGGRIAGGIGGFGYGPMAQPVEALGLRDALYDARTRAMERMRQECAMLGGDGVVAVHLTVAPFSAGGLEFQAVGTAIRADGPVRPPQPFLSDLTGQEFATLLAAGWVPCGLVLGVAVMARHDDWTVVRQAASWSNQEVGGYTDLVQATREAARSALRHDCARHGGTTVVVREMTLDVHERPCSMGGEDQHDHLAEAMVIGTALVAFEHAGGNAPVRPLPILRL